MWKVSVSHGAPCFAVVFECFITVHRPCCPVFVLYSHPFLYGRSLERFVSPFARLTLWVMSVRPAFKSPNPSLNPFKVGRLCLATLSLVINYDYMFVVIHIEVSLC